jgi:FAD/FMN-containing dehydrogenase
MDATRRSVLLASVGSAAVQTAAPALAEGIPSALREQARCDEPARTAAADDFGHIVHERPSFIVQPRSSGDVAAAIRWASAKGLHLAAQGQRHSVYGRAMARDGIVVVMSGLRTIQDLQADRIVVDAGATWREVLAATLPHGLAPPVVTEYLDLSVGGTLVGGVGSGTQRHGLQSDNVLAMDVVTGAGHEITCSAQSHAELFDMVRAGLGQVAVVTRATLKLVPAPQQVRRHLLFYPDLRSMQRDQRLLAAGHRFDVVTGAILAAPAGGWIFRLDAAEYFMGTAASDEAVLAGLSDDQSRRKASTLSYFEYLNRLSELETLLRDNGQWFLPHPWLMTFIGDTQVEAVVGDTLARLTPADLGPLGQISLSAISRRSITSPLVRLPADDLCYAFNLVRIPATDDAKEITRLIEDNRARYGQVCESGGTLYPVSALPMDHEDWRRHFGPAFGRLSDAKRRFDPTNVLTPGYSIF